MNIKQLISITIIVLIYIFLPNYSNFMDKGYDEELVYKYMNIYYTIMPMLVILIGFALNKKLFDSNNKRAFLHLFVFILLSLVNTRLFDHTLMLRSDVVNIILIVLAYTFSSFLTTSKSKYDELDNVDM